MKIIKLKPVGVGRYDDVSPFIITDRKLSLHIELPALNGEFYFLAENNGKSLKKLLPDSGQLELDGLAAGELVAEVRHYLKGELIKTYKVEPLILKEVDGKLVAEPEIIAVCRDIEEVKETLADERKTAGEREESIKLQIKNLEEQIKMLNANVAALLRFARDDYLNNVYLGGESVEEFIDKYGFKLTEEGADNIKGDNKNED